MAPPDDLPGRGAAAVDRGAAMRVALDAAAGVRTSTSPNPWVGAVVLSAAGDVVGVGATEPPGGAHAEVVALRAAGPAAAGGTLVVTLEPCAHHGRTPPCVDAVIAAGVREVVVGIVDPDTRVAGRGVAALRGAGVGVTVGLLEVEVAEQLQAYVHHRRSGRPYVVCKLAITVDGGIAAADGSSQWITGAAARTDAHRLRAESDAIVVGAGTVRVDDPALTVRHVDGSDPLRVVLGTAPAGARVQPCLHWQGGAEELLDDLGGRGVVQVLVEGGSRAVRSFFEPGLIDRFVLYVAPALLAGVDLVPMIAGPSAPSIGAMWRGRFADVRRLGDDLRIDLVPDDRSTAMNASTCAPRPGGST
jgi:diaminohydroxyphosphoribosylaminopyrimidine deaminase/5-amino-6-(5-phosphoribosylamino)uracil reductase